jgi:hypothetical protein
MKALHRIVVAGALGGAAAATVASSGAFACSAEASLTITAMPVRGYVLPGDLIEVKADKFYDTTVAELRNFSQIEVVWRHLDGRETPLTTLAKSGTFTFRVPADARPNLETRQSVLARQFSPAGQQVAGPRPEQPPPAPFLVWDGSAPPTTTSPVTARANPGSTSTAAPRLQQGNGDRTKVPPSGDAGLSLAPGAQRVIAGAPRAAGTAGVLSPELAAGGVAAIDGPRAGPGSPVALGEVPSAAQAEQAVNDLWSGVGGGGGAILLDGAVPERPRPSPLGGFLVAGGALALAAAGVALGVGRRRLVLPSSFRR